MAIHRHQDCIGVLSDRNSFSRAGAKEKFGTTPILEYIKDGDPVGLEEHLANFPNSQELNQAHPQNGNTPLHVCCLELKLEKREAILQILLTVCGEFSLQFHRFDFCVVADT